MHIFRLIICYLQQRVFPCQFIILQSKLNDLLSVFGQMPLQICRLPIFLLGPAHNQIELVDNFVNGHFQLLALLLYLLAFAISGLKVKGFHLEALMGIQLLDDSAVIALGLN